MTPDFADQEAERIITGLAWTYKPFLEKEIAEALRKAKFEGRKEVKLECDSAYKWGFEAAREMAAHHCENFDYKTGWVLSDEIRALKPEATNGESQSEGE